MKTLLGIFAVIFLASAQVNLPTLSRIPQGAGNAAGYLIFSRPDSGVSWRIGQVAGGDWKFQSVVSGTPVDVIEMVYGAGVTDLYFHGDHCYGCFDDTLGVTLSTTQTITGHKTISVSTGTALVITSSSTAVGAAFTSANATALQVINNSSSAAGVFANNGAGASLLLQGPVTFTSSGFDFASSATPAGGAYLTTMNVVSGSHVSIFSSESSGEPTITPGSATGNNAAGIVVLNPGAGSATAAYEFNVSNGSESGGLIKKSAIGFQRTASNGRGVLRFYNNGTNDSSNWSSTGEIFNLTSTGANLFGSIVLSASGGVQTIFESGAGNNINSFYRYTGGGSTGWASGILSTFADPTYYRTAYLTSGTPNIAIEHGISGSTPITRIYGKVDRDLELSNIAGSSSPRMLTFSHASSGVSWNWSILQSGDLKLRSVVTGTPADVLEFVYGAGVTDLFFHGAHCYGCFDSTLGVALAGSQTITGNKTITVASGTALTISDSVASGVAVSISRNLGALLALNNHATNPTATFANNGAGPSIQLQGDIQFTSGSTYGVGTALVPAGPGFFGGVVRSNSGFNYNGTAGSTINILCASGQAVKSVNIGGGLITSIACGIP